MKVVWTGSDEITIRGVTFEPGKSVNLADDLALLQKVEGISGFEKAPARRKPTKKAPQND